MPAWITIYLQAPLAELDSNVISQGIASTDWWLLGESIGITEDSVDVFMQRLHWTANSLEFTVEPNQRPVQIAQWTEPERVQEAIDELEGMEPTFRR